MAANYQVDAYQGVDGHNTAFGWVAVGRGGMFFTYPGPEPVVADADDIETILDSLEDDPVDPPTGRYSMRSVRRAVLAALEQRMPTEY